MYLESVLKGYRLLPVPENPELRTRLADKSLEELTDILKGYKACTILRMWTQPNVPYEPSKSKSIMPIPQ